LPAFREPIFTSCPSALSFEAIVLPTIPVPSTPIFMPELLSPRNVLSSIGFGSA